MKRTGAVIAAGIGAALVLSVVLFLGALTLGVGLPFGGAFGKTEDFSAGNISYVSSGLPQWEAQGGTYTATVTFHRDDSGSDAVAGNFTFGLPEDGYRAENVSFKGWQRGSNLTLAFNYTVPADAYAGSASPAFRLEIDGGANATFDYLNETGRYVFVSFAIADPEPQKRNLGNDDLSTLVPPGYYDQRFVEREADAYYNSLNAAKALTNGVEPYRTKDVYGAMKNVTAYVNGQMTSDPERWQDDPFYGDFTQSDWYLGFNQSGYGPRYHGICKDYSSLARSYFRSMGIPAKFIICVEKDKDGKVKSHAWTEAWDGSRWIQSDPTWNLFDSPQAYKEAGYTDLQIRELSICQVNAYSVKKAGSGSDLVFQAWVYGDAKNRVDFEIVEDRGLDPAYN